MLGYHHLGFQVQVLNTGKDDAGNERRLQGMAINDAGSRNVFVHHAHDEHADAGKQDPGHQGFQALEKQQLAGEDEVQHVGVDHGAGEEDDDHERRQDGDADDNADHLEETVLPIHLPHIVEDLPDGNHQRQHNPHEGGHGDKAEETALGRFHNVVGGPQERLGNVLLSQVNLQDLGELLP